LSIGFVAFTTFSAETGPKLLIVHVITTIERGGAEKALLSLAKEQANRGDRVLVLPLKGKKDLYKDFVSSGVEVNFSLLNIHLVAQALILKRLTRQLGVRILHAHLPRAEVLVRLTVKPKQRISFFVTRHNAEIFWPQSGQILSSCLSRWVLKSCSALIAISEEVKEFILLQKESPSNLPLVVIYYGYQRIYENEVSLSRAKSVDNKKLEIVTVSRLAHQKNLKLALQLIHELNSEGIDTQLTIVGTGPLEKDLKGYSVTLGIDAKVIFFGGTKDVFSTFHGKDIFLMTSLYEGFGLAVLEAIDFGLPVCAPNHSAFIEVLGDKTKGLYCPNDLKDLVATVKRVARDDQFRLDLKYEQNLRLPHFTMKKYLDRHVELYNKAVVD